MFFLGVLFGVGGVFLVAYIATKRKEKQGNKAQKQAVSVSDTETVTGVNEEKGVNCNG